MKIAAIVLLGLSLTAGAFAQDSKKPDPPKPTTPELSLDQQSQLDKMKAQYIEINRRISALPGYKEMQDQQTKLRAQFAAKGSEYCGPGYQIVEPTGQNDWTCQLNNSLVVPPVVDTTKKK